MKCPGCKEEMTRDPVRDIQLCDREGCTYPYIITGLQYHSLGERRIQSRAFDDQLQTHYDFYGFGRSAQLEGFEAASPPPEEKSILAQLLEELDGVSNREPA